MNAKKTKKPVGRPFKEPESRKDKQVHIRCTTSELEELNQRVALSGMKQSAYLRKLLGFECD